MRGRIGKSIFFCVHFGLFCLHGLFVTTLFLSGEALEAMHAAPQWTGAGVIFQALWLGANAMGLFSPGALLLPLVALVVSHGVSFYANYLRNGRYRRSGPQDSFMRPYPRMVLLHVCIIGGGFLIASQGSSGPMRAAHGNLAVSADERGAMFLWDINLFSWIDKACNMAGRNISQSEWPQYFPGEPYHLTCHQWPAGE